MIIIEWDRIFLATLIGLLMANLPTQAEFYPIMLRSFSIIAIFYLLYGSIERFDPPGVG